MNAGKVLQLGTKRLIGDGRTTRIWSDPRAPFMHRGGCVTPRSPEAASFYHVSELLSGRSWNTTLIDTIFSPWEAIKIKGMILSSFSCPDEWMWTTTKSGEFSVKFAYYLAKEENQREEASSSIEVRNKLWKAVWGVRVMPKIRNFAWRATNNALHVGVNLKKRLDSVDPICARCGEEEESIEHMLLECRHPQRLWYLSPLRLTTQQLRADSFKAWVSDRLDSGVLPEWLEIFWNLCWTIWLARNDWFFSRLIRDPMRQISKAVSACEEYRQAILRDVGRTAPRRILNSKWLAPNTGMLKLNVDVAFKENTKVGMGAVLRDASGDVLMAACDT